MTRRRERKKFYQQLTNRYSATVGSPRLIPVICLDGDKSVKTQGFKHPRYVGDPVNTTALLSSFETEELVVLDISESFGSEPTSRSVLSRIVENAFMPIAFGGRIRTFDDAREIFDLGFDKVVLRSSLFDTCLTPRIVDNYGAQAVTGCLDIQYVPENPRLVVVNGRVVHIDSFPEILEKINHAGIGELVIQDIERDGTRQGLRSHTILQIAIETLEIPIVPLGGLSKVEEAAQFLKSTGCHSVAASTVFLFRPTREAILVSYPSRRKWYELLEGQ